MWHLPHRAAAAGLSAGTRFTAAQAGQTISGMFRLSCDPRSARRPASSMICVKPPQAEWPDSPFGRIAMLQRTG
jgi:hypothetical protein